MRVKAQQFLKGDVVFDMSAKETPKTHSEALEQKRKRAGEILAILRTLYPNAKCHLHFKSPYQLLVASILAAQCTDERVNQITPGLFSKYPTIEAFANANQEELEREIYSTGFYKNKAKSIISSARGILEKHGGVVPDSIEELTKLSGIGRKTANVVLGNAFGMPAIIVDTHIRRVSRRLGLTGSGDPDKIEKDLMALIPKESWTYFSNSLGDHGRTICKARKPLCTRCKLAHLCPSAVLD